MQQSRQKFVSCERDGMDFMTLVLPRESWLSCVWFFVRTCAILHAIDAFHYCEYMLYAYIYINV